MKFEVKNCLDTGYGPKIEYSTAYEEFEFEAESIEDAIKYVCRKETRRR